MPERFTPHIINLKTPQNTIEEIKTSSAQGYGGGGVNTLVTERSPEEIDGSNCVEAPPGPPDPEDPPQTDDEGDDEG